MTYNVLTLAGSVWLSVFVLMSIVWLIFLKIKQASIVDVFWSLAITLSAFIWGCGAAHSWPVMTLKSLLIIWAVRLAGYLFFTRIFPGHTDRRYDQLSAHWSISKQLGFFLNFQLQGALAMIIACPFYWLDSFTGVDGFYIIAVMMITLGWIGECVSDYQLWQFQLSHPKQVCQTGLWRYSRHPNCFFDWLIWLGFAVAVIGQPMGGLALFSPILLGYLMIKVTIPMTERASLKSRGKKYQIYQDKTPIFFPWLSKHHH